MTTEVRWGAYDNLARALSSGLDSLGNGNTALSAVIDFNAAGADRKQYMDLELSLASVDLSAQTNPAIYVWLLARTDGTNFEDGSAGTPGVVPARAPDAIFPLRAANGAQRVFRRLVLTTPDQGKLLLQNNAGAALATGNTLKYYTYGDELV
jgi:hypothetical protein